MKRWQVDGLLLLVVMIWGSTFFVVRDAVQSWPPVLFVALRFAVATGALLPICLPTFKQSWHWSDMRVGVLLGCLLWAGYSTQTIGLSYIQAARAGFITGLNVVMVPLLGVLLWREPLRIQVLLGVGFAVFGMWLLTRGEQQLAAPSGLGDGLMLLCALMFAGHIVAVGRFARGRSIWTLTLVQVATVALLSLSIGLVVEPWPPWSWSVMGAALYLGVIATVVTLLLQTLAQRYASPTHTALIFVLEPVFAAVFAAVFGNEILSSALLSGGACMLLGIVLAELPPLHAKRKERTLS